MGAFTKHQKASKQKLIGRHHQENGSFGVSSSSSSSSRSVVPQEIVDLVENLDDESRIDEDPLDYENYDYDNEDEGYHDYDQDLMRYALEDNEADDDYEKEDDFELVPDDILNKMHAKSEIYEEMR